MVTVETITPQRIAEILEFPAVYDEDCPELTDEQRSRLRPKYRRDDLAIACYKRGAALAGRGSS